MVATSMAAPAPAGAQGWQVLAVLSALLGFASISTDFYLPALPTMAASLHSDPGTVAFTISGYLIGFSLGELLRARSATGMAAAGRSRSGWCCS